MKTEKKTYKYPKTPKLLKKLIPFWKRYEAIIDVKYEAMEKLNKEMEKAIGIKGIEICEFETGAGIGNDERTLELFHDFELTEGKIDKEL